MMPQRERHAGMFRFSCTGKYTGPEPQETLMRALCLFLFAFIAAPLSAADDPATLSVSAWADVDAEGRVSGLEFRSELPASIESIARNLFQPLTFEPATVGGQPVPSRTSLRTSLELSPDGAGGYVVKVVDLQQIGSSAASTPPPRYPADALFGGVGGKIWLELSIDAQGHVSADSIEVVEARFHRDRKSYKGRLAEQLVEAARTAALQWTFVQPQVAGVPVATRQRVPVTFTPPAKGRGKPYDYGDFESRPQSPRSMDADRTLAQLIAPETAARN
jgi:hypothetical protein